MRREGEHIKDHWEKRSAQDVQDGLPGTYVKVTKVDECQLPDYVRAVSTGVVLSADPLVRFSVIAGQGHAEARDSDRLPGIYVYVVPRAEAIKRFSDLNREVAVYWEMLSFPRTNKDKTLLFFRGTEVEEIAGTFIRPTLSPD